MFDQRVIGVNHGPFRILLIAAGVAHTNAFNQPRQALNFQQLVDWRTQVSVCIKLASRRLPLARSSRLQTAASPCTRAIDRTSHAGYRSILVLTSLANTRAGQSKRYIPAAPIRTRELSLRQSGQRQILTHLDASRLHTHASRNITLKAVPFPIQIFVPFICI